jgi:hypothetical protein
MSTITPVNPAHEDTNINDILHQLDETSASSTEDTTLSTTSISKEQLSALLQMLRQQQSAINALTAASTPPKLTPIHGESPYGTHKPPEYYNNAKYEDIIKPPYDGSLEQLIPFLNCLDIRRQDEVWYPITFLTIHGIKYDLICQFAKIDESIMLQEAKLRWLSPHVSAHKHTIDHPTFNARVLARLLLGSVTDDFCITIISRISQEYRNDGLLILWIICNNIHQNSIAFIESIKCRVRESTLSQFRDDVPKYILYIKDNLRLITTSDTGATPHNDLLVYLFAQLQLCKVPLFKEAIDAWHIAYLEAKLPTITPDMFLKMVDDKIQILKHADQWKESENPEIMALKLELQKQKQESDIIMKNLVAHVSRFANINWFNNNGNTGHKHPLPGNNHDPPTHTSTYPPRMIVPPQHPTETKLVDCRLYTWCTKYRPRSLGMQA